HDALPICCGRRSSATRSPRSTPRSARSSTTTSTRRCSRSRPPSSRRARWPRCCSRAIPSPIGCCARRWSGWRRRRRARRRRTATRARSATSRIGSRPGRASGSTPPPEAIGAAAPSATAPRPRRRNSVSEDHMTEGVDKVVLAYSGGLDTSVILRWLQDRYDCDVVTFTADLGQGEELEPARAKAELLGATQIFVEDLREEFVRDYVFPMFRANALYEGAYLLGTSIARPLIAKRLVEIAHEVGADAVAHGATGKGNDQVRFELSAYALDPDIKVIAPWREWDLNSRGKLLEYAAARQIPIARDKGGEPPYSMDANLLHISYEGRALEDPWQEPDPGMYLRSVAPEDA